MARPSDASGDGWQVSHDGRVCLVLSVAFFDLLEDLRIVLQKDFVLLVAILSEHRALQNVAEFAEKLEGVFNVRNVIEIAIDVIAEINFDLRDLNVEFDVVLVKQTILVVEKFVIFLLEFLDRDGELVNDGLNSFEVVFLELLELLDGAEKFPELTNSAAEQLKLVEDGLL